MTDLPNVIFIGPDKAGSTWLFQAFMHHPDVFITPAKDLYFFDRYYGRGLSWYRRQFAGSEGHSIIAEISHDYLYSPSAAQRMQENLPDARLLVCLREPVERTFSAYLHLVKTGIFSGSFKEALDAHPNLVERSRYAKWLLPYLRWYPRNQLYCLIFDELRRDPLQFARELWRQLGIAPIDDNPLLQSRVLPASRSRSVRLTRWTRKVAQLVREAGYPGVVGRVKNCRAVQRILYASYRDGQRPLPKSDEVDELRRVFTPDVRQLDQLLGTCFCQLWGYGELSGEEETAASGLESFADVTH